MFGAFILFLTFKVKLFSPQKNCSQPDLRQDVFITEDPHYLNVPRVGTYTVYDVFDCTFKCLSKLSCLSLTDLPASKGADGKLWCQLLSFEKYSNPKENKANESSHHFSIKVGLNSRTFCGKCNSFSLKSINRSRRNGLRPFLNLELRRLRNNV